MISPLANASRHGPVSSSYCCSSSWLAISSATATVNTRPCSARVIPQVTAGSTVRTANSATSCTSSVNESVASNNPASSDSAEFSEGGNSSDIRVDPTRRHEIIRPGVIVHSPRTAQRSGRNARTPSVATSLAHHRPADSRKQRKVYTAVT